MSEPGISNMASSKRVSYFKILDNDLVLVKKDGRKITMMARRPRAPVFFSIACFEIALSASGENVNST